MKKCEEILEKNGRKFRRVLSNCEKYWNYFDAETGKEIRGMAEQNVRDEDRLTRAEDIEAFKKQQEQDLAWDINKKRGFVQMKRAIQDVLGNAKQYHSHLFMKILPLVSFDDKPIKYRGLPMNQAKIISYLGIQKKVAIEFLDSFVELKILEEIPGAELDGGKKSEKYYKLSGEYMIKGAFDEHEQYSVKVFLRYLSEVVKEVEKVTESYIKRQKKNKMELYPLSLLLTLLPFVQRQSLIICANPEIDLLEKHYHINEALKKPRFVKRLTDKQIWNSMTGQDMVKLTSDQQKKLKTYFEILKKTNVIGSFEGKNKIYIMNPKLVFVLPYLQDDAWVVSLTNLFGLVE